MTVLVDDAAVSVLYGVDVDDRKIDLEQTRLTSVGASTLFLSFNVRRDSAGWLTQRRHFVFLISRI